VHKHLSEEWAEMAAYIEASAVEETDTDLEPLDEWSLY